MLPSISYRRGSGKRQLAGLCGARVCGRRKGLTAFTALRLRLVRKTSYGTLPRIIKTLAPQTASVHVLLNINYQDQAQRAARAIAPLLEQV